MESVTMTSEEAVLWLRSRPDLAEITRTSYFDEPIAAAAHRFFISAEWSAVRSLLGNVREKSVLDVGAGRGIASYAFAKDQAKVTALEPDQSDIVGSGALKRLRDDSNLDFEIVEDWAESMPFKNSSFDLVYARQVLHHANNLGKFCKEIFRILKPGGLFLACREHVAANKNDLEKFLHTHILNKYTHNEYAYSLWEYKYALKEAGFRIKSIFGPWESLINIFPADTSVIKNRICKKLHLPVQEMIPDGIAVKIGRLYRNKVYFPGCLYSFYCLKAQ